MRIRHPSKCSTIGNCRGSAAASFCPEGPAPSRRTPCCSARAVTLSPIAATARRSASPGCLARSDPIGRRVPPCECEALIEAGTPLTPGNAARILACPLAAPRVAWAWYTLPGRPVMFMVTSLPGDEGSGSFALLDYRSWTPHRQVPRSAFAKPPQCRALPAGTPVAAPSLCATCQLAAPRHYHGLG